MARKGKSPEPKLYSTNAYFEMVMNCKLYTTVPERVLRNPKFWEFLESTRLEPDREEWAGQMLRRKGAKGIQQMLEEMREADMDYIPEGGKFRFLRDVCYKMNNGQREAEASGYDADDEDPETKSQNSKPWRLCNFVTEPEPLTSGPSLGVSGMLKDVRAQIRWRPCFLEPWTPERNQVKGRRIWEWNGYDSEAEHWLFAQQIRVSAANGNIRISGSEGDKTCEWTQYDEEAEQEEAKRKGKELSQDFHPEFDLDLDPDLDPNLHIFGLDSIERIFGAMSLSDNGES